MIRGRALAAVAALAALGGCATTNADPRDPFEGVNRGIYRFNDTFDQAITRPVATAYRDYVHQEIRDRVRNFFSNLADPFIGVNNVLQGKFEDGVLDWARFAFNSTIVLLGIHDVATDMGYEKHNEDFTCCRSSARAPCATALARASTSMPTRWGSSAPIACSMRCGA